MVQRKKLQQPIGGQLDKKSTKHLACKLWNQRQLWLMLLPGLLFYLIYRYSPMFGLVISFKDYSPFLGVFESKWVGLEHFERFFSTPKFWELFRNTLTLGCLSLCISFPMTILFALILNEVRQKKAKKVFQTISYLPNFLSIVIVCSIFIDLFSVTHGTINKLIIQFGGAPIDFRAKPEWYYFIYITSELWAGLGSGAIIYLAALSGVDHTLYEAADLDGCSRIKKVWHVTLPSIMPTIITMFLLRVGNIIRIGADKTLLLYAPTTYEVADIFSSYVYRVGMGDHDYSFAAAVGMFESVLAALILVAANKGSKKLTGESLW